ncbi:hypothetical protein [Myroides injenensis]|uniref:hypothetical protein n=1 Tax=Myroides injenensis TaxID=1183151 RepID=UPI0022715522|nr:hypothetical protein [Myroides injenensis]
MKTTFKFILQSFIVLLLLVSCKDEDKLRQVETEKLTMHNDSVFNYLENNWSFKFPNVTADLNGLLEDWKPWNDFKQEMELKPMTSISAYQKKIDLLDTKIQSIIYTKFPQELNTRDIKARITVLQNSIKNLQMFLYLEPIDIPKIETHIKEVKKDLTILIDKMEEIVVKNHLPSEVGEEEMLQLLDTTRMANPENK